MSLRLFGSFRIGSAIMAWMTAIAGVAVLSASTDGADNGPEVDESLIRQLVSESRRILDSGQVDSAMTLAHRADSLTRSTELRDEQIAIEVANALGWCYFQLAEYAEAERHWKNAYARKGATDAVEDSLMADLTANFGRLYYRWAKLDTASSSYERAIEMQRALFPADHPDLAASYNNLGNIRQAQGRYDEAAGLIRRALSIWEQQLGSDHADVGLCLNNLAIVYDDWGKFREADSCYHRALEIREKIYGPTDMSVGYIVYNIGALRYRLGFLDDAKSMASRARDIFAAVFGENHPSVAQCSELLAKTGEDEGEFESAEDAYLRALAVYRDYFGEHHHTTAATLTYLASLYHNLGRYDEALRVHRESEAAYRAILGDQHPNIAKLLESRARFYAERDYHDEAIEHYNRALEVYTVTTGLDFPGALSARLSLALARCNAGQLDEAERELHTLLPLLTKLYNGDHIDIAYALNGLGTVEFRRGNWDHSVALLRRSLEGSLRAFGDRHPLVAVYELSLAEAHASAGNVDSALVHFRTYIGIRQWLVNRAFSISSEYQKKQWLERHPIVDGRIVTLATQVNRPDATELAFDMILKGKARVLDAMMTERFAIACSNDPSLDSARIMHADVCGSIATLVLGEHDSKQGLPVRDSLSRLYALADSVEVALAKRCPEYRDDRRQAQIGAADVTAHLKGGRLWEITRYSAFDLERVGSDSEREDPPRYAAFVMSETRPLQLVDLGPAAAIDSLVREFRERIGEAAVIAYSDAAAFHEERVQQIGRALFDLVASPLISLDGSGGPIYVAPDGMLNLVPFEVMVDKAGRYLSETLDVRYITTGRDLVPKHQPRSMSHTAVILADPDFDHASAIPTAAEHASADRFRGQDDCRPERFTRLRFGRNEGEAVAKRLSASPDTRIVPLYGAEASETRLKSMAIAPRILHIATHGYFCDQAEGAPLLRSGLALAGANGGRVRRRASESSGDDGLLTALEVSHLDLVGTQLTTLSACETGVGEVVDGEGVVGLRRAFQHAGSGAVLMSLWMVPDRETSMLIEDFYTRWLSGEPLHRALQKARRAALDRCRFERRTGHPLFWGGFIVVGSVN